MSLKNLKLELFYWRKALFEYRNFFKYIKNKYFLARKILKSNKVFEKPINNQDLSVHILTNHHAVIMTLWALVSYYQNIKIVGQLFIHDDGSLNNQDKNIFKKFFPTAKVITQSPEWDNWIKVVNKKIKTTYSWQLKKLNDPYFVSDKKYHLIIDTDLLWFDNPREIENEIENKCQNSFMLANNYLTKVGFKDGTELSDELAGYNSGIVLYNKENFDLEKLQYYLNNVIETKDGSWFVEQAGYATCLKNLKKLPEKKYTIRGTITEDTIVKHYTSPRRPLFYIEGIEEFKNILNP